MHESRPLHAGLPDLDEVRPLEHEAIVRFHGGYGVTNSLKQLGLAVYETDDGYYWFGAEDLVSTLEHDRWLYRIEQGAIEAAASWEDVDYTRISECGTVFVEKQKDRGENFAFVLDLMSSYFQKMLNSRSYPRADSARLKQDFLSTYQSFGLLPAPLTKIAWTQAAHDILHHPEAWLARNELKGVPRDLLLRMHGLGCYTDELQGGRDWLDY